tara:strand:- start:49877 stop:50806 length:930 start_codon:yes stop_codon:yes gene_type:complete
MSTSAEQTDGTVVTLDELIALRLQAQQIHLATCHRVTTTLMSDRQSTLSGRGMEFADFRVYQAGDDVKHMDWRVTARTGVPHIRVYQEERERPVYIVLDQSATMQFGTRVAFKSVIAARTAALLAWAAVNNHDRVGGFIAGHDEPFEIKAKSGKTSALQFCKQIIDAQSQPLAHNLTDTLSRLRRVTKPGSLVFVLSDFTHFDEEAQRHLSRVAKHNDVIAGFIVDPLEMQAPKSGIYTFSDGEKKVSLNTYDKSVIEAYHKGFETRANAVQDFCHKHRINLLPIPSEKPLLDSLRGLLHVRREARHAK